MEAVTPTPNIVLDVGWRGWENLVVASSSAPLYRLEDDRDQPLHRIPMRLRLALELSVVPREGIGGRNIWIVEDISGHWLSGFGGCWWTMIKITKGFDFQPYSFLTIQYGPPLDVLRTEGGADAQSSFVGELLCWLSSKPTATVFRARRKTSKE